MKKSKICILDMFLSMDKRICICLFLTFIAYADAQCSHCSDSEILDITDCITKLVADSTVLAIQSYQDDTNVLCDTTRSVMRCYKTCYCTCLADSDNTNAKNEIESWKNTLKLYSCPEFAESCLIWKEGNLHVNSSSIAIASKFVMLISCLFLFMLIQ